MGGVLGQRYHIIPVCALSPLHHPQSSSIANGGKEDWTIIKQNVKLLPKSPVQSKAAVQPKRETSALSSEDDVP